MNKNLLIIGAGCCGLSAREIARDMGCFGKIAFLDDKVTKTHDGTEVLGKICDFENFALEYGNVFVAVANPQFKLDLLKKIKETTPYKIATLVSPRAYISPTAQIMQGSIVEAMATVNTGAVVSTGCIVGAGSVVNHCSMLCDGVHLECNASVADNALVPAGTFVESGTFFKSGFSDVNDLFLNNKVKKQPKTPAEGVREYCFEDGM